MASQHNTGNGGYGLNGLVGTGGAITLYDTNNPGNIIGPATVNPYSALTIAAWWRGVQFLSSNLASFPRTVRKGGTPTKHKLDIVLERKPNGYQNAHQLWATAFFHAVHFGNGFVRIVRGADGLSVAELHNMLPENIVPYIWEGQKWFHVLSTKEHIPASDMLHLQDSVSYDGLAGYPPVWVLRETLQRSLMIGRYQTRFLMKGSIVRGVIELNSELTEEQSESCVKRIRTYHQGSDADDDLLIVQGGKFANSTMSPKDSELTQQVALNTREIGMILGIDPIYLFERSDTKYNGGQDASEDLVKYTFRPRIEAWEPELTLKLLTTSEQDAGLSVHLNPDALQRGNTKAESDRMVSEVKSGLRTRNEARIALGLPRDPDPESDRLMALGDTTVNLPKDAPPEAQPIKHSALVPEKGQSSPPEAFQTLFDDVGNRVETKTAKATTTNKKKFGADKQGWVPWSNAFADEQRGYLATSLAPIVQTLQAIGHELPSDLASTVGQRYANALRRYHSDLFSNPEAIAPKVSEIITTELTKRDSHEV